MAIDKFKFISPGVFINEIDESTIPNLPERMGPVLLGRFKKGPSNRPVTVTSYNEMVAQFGTPAPGTATGDIWRTGAMTAPTYAAYAAQAWLRNNTPCTIVRLLGVANDEATGFFNNPTSEAGWRTSNQLAETGTPGGAYGLFVLPDPDSTGHGAVTSSVTVQLLETAGANVSTTNIRIGLPKHLTGGGPSVDPTFSECLIFNFTTDIADPADDTIDVLATAATTDAAISGAMGRLVTLVNGGAAASPDSAAGTTTDHPTLAGVQAALSASYNDTDNRLTFHTKVGGHNADNIKIFIDEDYLANAGTEGAAEVAATASLQAVSATAAQYDGGTLTITNTAGLEKTYVFDDDDGGATGTLDGTDVRIQINGLGTPNVIAAQIKDAIESSNGHDDTISIVVSTADSANDTLTLTQAVAGSEGDKTITRATVTADGVYTISGFTGGDDGSHQLITLGTTTVPATAAADADITAITASVPAVVTGTLGAVWYVENGWAELSGTLRGNQDQTSRTAAALIQSTDQAFTVHIRGGGTDHTDSTLRKASTFNFTSTSDQFIRKSFNTDPTATNTDLVDTAAGGVVQQYWLGETFEDSVKLNMKKTPATGAPGAGTQVSASATGDFLGMILPLHQSSGAEVTWSIRNSNAAAASTGWFFSNDTRGVVADDNGFDPTNDAHVSKLFKLVALDNGENVNRDIKVSLTDIKAPSNQFIKYGTFSVVVRDAEDTDANPVVLERYSNLTLDPVASNYVERVIGNKEYVWDDVSKTVRQFGTYDNKSKWVRAEVSPLVQNGNAEGLLPYGVYGPVVMKGFRIVNNGTDGGPEPGDIVDDLGAALPSSSWVEGAGGSTLHTSSIDATNTALDGTTTEAHAWDAGTQTILASIVYPKSRIREKSTDGGLTLQTQAYWGYQSNRKGSADSGARVYAPENLDHLRGGPDSMNMHAAASGETEFSWIFTLDDIVVSSSAAGEVIEGTHTTGSRADGDSKTAQSGSTTILDAGFNRFTSPVFGGKDGLDIKEKDPFRNRYLAKGASATTNYAFSTIERNIDMIADPEFIEFDVAAIPGLTNQTLTDKLIVACEQRGDALAVIDLSGSYEPAHEGIDSGVTTSTRTGSVDNVVNNLKDRGLNSSYGCTFFPYVQVRDTVSDAILFVPPSVVAIGTFSSSQRKSAVWFAPAGFTRGGLSEGSAGIPVIGTRTRVTAAQRDKLYDANINPIATFPAEGVVIFGQKTLQVTPSALDRINVRRLLIFLKKEISRIASTTLFEQNVQATWDKFTGQVEPFLNSVKAGLGLTDFKVVLDKSTTTDDLIDRNIMYAKIFLKPARAIEFIALDFIITRSGASFDD